MCIYIHMYIYIYISLTRSPRRSCNVQAARPAHAFGARSLQALGLLLHILLYIYIYIYIIYNIITTTTTTITNTNNNNIISTQSHSSENAGLRK